MPDATEFQMHCPKCKSYGFTVRRDQRAYVHKSQPFELVFSCRCGKQLFGDQIQEEYDRQKAEWEANGGAAAAAIAKAKEESEAALRKQEEANRKEQLRAAMEYRLKYLAEKRDKAAEEERKRKEAEDQQWRERVAKVEAERGGDIAYLTEKNASRKSKPAATTRKAPKPIQAPPVTAAAKKPAAPKPKPPAASKAAAATPKPTTSSSPQDLKFDDSHPHAEFMELLVAGAFFEHFPDCTPPDVKDASLCIWPPCEKPRRKKSKYCSRECSNKNARWRHKMRKRG